MHNKCGPWTFVHLCALIHAKHNILQFIHLQASAEAVRLCNLRRIHMESLFLLSSQASSARGWALVGNKELVVSFELGPFWVWEKSPLSLRYALSASHEPNLSCACTGSVGRGRRKSSKVFLSSVNCQEIETFQNPLTISAVSVFV